MMIKPATDDLGVVLRRDLVATGVHDNAIARLVRIGTLVRLRHGVYADARRWAAASKVDRHRMLSRGVMRLYDGDVALSHVSAALAYGAPDHGLPLDEVHLTELSGTGERVQAKVRHHRGGCREDEVVQRDGHKITAPARTALDTAALVERDAAVCVLDWFYQQQLTDPDELRRELRTRSVWSDHLDLSLKLGYARVGSESVGESLARLAFLDAGLPEPVLQHEVRDDRGWLIGRVDFAWPEQRLIVEFDGREKYHSMRRDGESIEEMVLREKTREDRLREATGWTVIRITWADLHQPGRLLARLSRYLAPVA
ncbi:type IV toxin-antitoxin system AbiEi family antitoxin domain-containing protein [Nocardioides salarius]|uniref:type IV toxin-antitoxin system AbiEi family antitoxin domain-containing protein n=1 Tax=Nocardioides salarius TaxID=374513 RepID=UPI0030FA5B3D